MARLLMVPIDKVRPNPENPRGEIDTTTETFKGFVSTIKQRGLLQPLLVGPEDAEGIFTVIAGSRRYFGVVDAKLPEVPVMSIDAAGEELLLAAIENEQRENLTPVAQARQLKNLQERLGLNQVQAAEAMGKSERWARERERLLNMPEATQEAYDQGALPLESMGTVERIAKQAPKVVEALGEIAANNEQVRSALSGNRAPDALAAVIADAAENPNEDGTSRLGCFVFAGESGKRRASVTLDAVAHAGPASEGLDKAAAACDLWNDLREELRKVDRHAYVQPADPVWLEQADIDTAQTFGCLLDVNGALYITDADWLADLYTRRVEAAVGKLQKALEDAKASKGSANKPSGSTEDEEAAKARRREEREAEEARRAAVRANNLEMGQRADRAFKDVKLSPEEAEVLALMVIGNRAPEIAGRGLVYCYHDFQVEEALQRGGTKVTYAEGREAGEELVKAIKAARTAPAKLGIALRAIALAHFADQSCVAPSNRASFSLAWGVDESVPGLVDTIAEKRRILPDAVLEAKAKEEQTKAEKREIMLLAAVRASRAKLGSKRQALLDTSGVLEQTIDTAVSSRWLKEHEASGELSYTITANGKKRLEKLMAAEKERQSA